MSSLDQAGSEAWLRGLAASPIALRRTAFQDLKRLTLLLAYGIEDSPWRARTGFVPPVARRAEPEPDPRAYPAAGRDARSRTRWSSGPGQAAASRPAVLAAAGKRVLVLERAAMVAEDGFGGPELDGLGALFLDRGLAATSDRWISIRAGSAVGGGTGRQLEHLVCGLRTPSGRSGGRPASATTSTSTTPPIESGHVRELRRERAQRPERPARRRARGARACRTRPSRATCATAATADRARWAAAGARSSPTLRTFLASACDAGTEILDRTEALRVLVERGRTAGVMARVPGGEITVRAPLVALAGGSILSPSVLQRSGIARGTAGRNLHIHPWQQSAGSTPRASRPWSGVPQGVMSDAFAEIDGTWGFRLEAAPTHPGLIASGFPWWDSPASHREFMARCDRRGGVPRDRPRPEHRAASTSARDGGVTVRYAAGRGRSGSCSGAASLELARLHRAAGAERIVPLVTPPLDWRPGSHSSPGWRTREARPSPQPDPAVHRAPDVQLPDRDEPADSVADPDGQVHDVPGLYVTDASAMPTASGVNPMLSLMALARRTAFRMVAAS